MGLTATHTFLLMCVQVRPVARKTRMDMYADRELEAQVQNAAAESDMSVSEWLREAARQKLQREESDA